jgi:hypothetical protein
MFLQIFRQAVDGSKLGSNLPVLLAAKSGLNGVESTISYKVNSRTTNFIRLAGVRH